MKAMLESIRELYVISDLHLGGVSEELWLFRQDQALAGLLRHVTHRCAASDPGQVALVIAGDVVDFLIPQSAQEATRGEQPYIRPAQQAVQFVALLKAQLEKSLPALRQFLAHPRARLITLLGNHDLELRLPPVWQAWVQLLSDGNAELAGRIEALLDEEGGLSCRVGEASVRVVHGNHVDSWNQVDLAALRQLAAQPDSHARTFAPNPGTALVVDVINAIVQAKSLPFLHLLKPECSAALQTLLAVRRDTWDDARIRRLVPRLPTMVKQEALSTVRLFHRGIRRRLGLLGDSVDGEDTLLQEESSPTRRSTVPDVGYLSQAKKDHEAELRPMDLVEENEDTLGWLRFARDALRQVSKDEALRQALQDWVAEDCTFDLGRRDMMFQLLIDWQERNSVDSDFLIAGHTHLARAIERADGGYYFNSGTWIPLIRLQPRVLASLERFAPLKRALLDKPLTLPELATEGFLWLRPTVVRLRVVGNETHGDLCAVEALPNHSAPNTDEEPEAQLRSLQEFPFRA